MAPPPPVQSDYQRFLAWKLRKDWFPNPVVKGVVGTTGTFRPRPMGTAYSKTKARDALQHARLQLYALDPKDGEAHILIGPHLANPTFFSVLYSYKRKTARVLAEQEAITAEKYAKRNQPITRRWKSEVLADLVEWVPNLPEPPRGCLKALRDQRLSDRLGEFGVEPEDIALEAAAKLRDLRKQAEEQGLFADKAYTIGTRLCRPESSNAKQWAEANSINLAGRHELIDERRQFLTRHHHRRRFVPTPLFEEPRVANDVVMVVRGERDDDPPVIDSCRSVKVVEPEQCPRPRATRVRRSVKKVVRSVTRRITRSMTRRSTRQRPAQ